MTAADQWEITPIVKGERHAKLTARAESLLAKQHLPAETLALLQCINTASCRPPLSDHEVETLVDDLQEKTRDAAAHRLVRMLFWDQIMTSQDPTWLVADLLVEDSIAWLYGKQHSFKGFLAISLALHVATGRPWFGRATKPRAVVYFAAEGQRGIKKRLKAAADYHGINAPAVYLVPHAIDLAKPDHVAAAVLVTSEIRPGLIIVDTYFRYSPGRSPRDDGDFSAILPGIEALRTANEATLLVIDHANKDGQGGATGTHQKEASADTVLELKRDEMTLSATVKMTKQKDFDEAADIELRLVPFGESLVLEVIDATGEPALHESESVALHALAAVQDDPQGVTATVWRKATDLPDRTFYRARGSLVRGNLVDKHQKLYRLTPGGNALTATATVLPPNCHGTGSTTAATPPFLRGGSGSNQRNVS